MPDDLNPPNLNDIDTAPDDAAVSDTDLRVSVDDLRTQLSRVGAERDELFSENEKLKRQDRTHEILDSLIIPYAQKTFFFMCVYCGAVGAVLIMHGRTDYPFNLPEIVLTFLVGSTATTVIGLVGMVLTGIFVGARPKKD